MDDGSPCLSTLGRITGPDFHTVFSSGSGQSSLNNTSSLLPLYVPAANVC